MNVPIPFDWLFLALRLAFVGVLYLFLWQVIRIIMRDLRQAPPPAPKKRSGKATLIVLDPAESPLVPGATLSVANKATLGRHPDCAIAIDEPFLSSIHAEFVARDGAWYLTDRSSTNGTFVNGERVTGTTYVETDDVIQFGRMTARFVA